MPPSNENFEHINPVNNTVSQHVQFRFLFLVYDPNTTKSGSPAFRRWRADDGPTLNAGFLASLFFRGSGPLLLGTPISGGPDPLPPPPSGSANSTITHCRPTHCTMRKIHITLTTITWHLEGITSSLFPSEMITNLEKTYHYGNLGLVCLFDLILYVPSTIFQFNRDGSSCVDSVLS